AVTIAAQWLTLPLILFYFRQFPNLFLLTNFIAVPLSSIILIGELLLCAVSWLDPVATATGWALHWMIWLMNASIERLEKIPFSTWNDLSISLPQTILLYAIIFYGSNLMSKINTHK
ncbi:MAG: ComEC/Rec2 family competence protein, partial [Chitinophagaceae bacterium]|nr:ComEC/Rec2 family competence protein [Chitinophagaceae bacterium]